MQFTVTLVSFVTIIALSSSALSAAIPEPLVDRSARVCGMHVKQYIEPTRLEYTIVDSTQTIVAQNKFTVKKGGNKLFAFPSGIQPGDSSMHFSAALNDNILEFAYKGKTFSTFDGCSVGGWSKKARDMDCVFPC